jgi:hypothetical protein
MADSRARSFGLHSTLEVVVIFLHMTFLASLVSPMRREFQSLVPNLLYDGNRMESLRPLESRRD